MHIFIRMPYLDKENNGALDISSNEPMEILILSVIILFTFHLGYWLLHF